MSELTDNEGVESKRRGARYPATSGATPSSRRTGTRGGQRRGAVQPSVEDAAGLEPPIRVTSVADDPRVKGRARVRCQSATGTVTLAIGASGVRAFNLRAGAVLDGVSWAGLLRESRVVVAQDAALRMLSTSRRSRRDLEVRLRRRESDPTVIADALGRLDAIGLLNDDEFAIAEAAAQLRNGSRSTGAVKRRLRQRGVAGEIADAAVAVAVNAEGVNDAERCSCGAWMRRRRTGGWWDS
jgi:SOS response regulatory protein OraA/RecX